MPCAVQHCTQHSALNSAGLLGSGGVEFAAAGGCVCCCQGLSLLLPGVEFAAASTGKIICNLGYFVFLSGVYCYGYSKEI